MSTLLSTDIRGPITESLSAFKRLSLAEASRGLFTSLGYSSDRRITLNPNSVAEFIAQFGALNAEKAMTTDWMSVDFLFQLTDEEIGNRLAFSTGKVDNAIIESYVFLAVHLNGEQYSRGRLATIAREINKLFPMPVMLLFRHGEAISLAVIDRELNKRDASKDVLRRVTLIKDIQLVEPARAHLDILHELSLPALFEEFRFRNFVELHRAWSKKLDTSRLNKEFYQEVSYWYLWAKNHPDVRLPKDVESSDDEQRSIFFIRLLTRLIFCWFLQEKGLIPRKLFRWPQVRELLKDSDPSVGTYYKAVLQNLFFATLNREVDKRGFRDKTTTGRYDKNRGVTTLYRYEELISDQPALRKLFDQVPFVNGGLFDCLDDVYRKTENEPSVRLDGFSDNLRESLTLPNELFFGKEQHADLSEEFDDKRKRDVSVRPFMEILSRYKFTVEENTPLEQEIALDPELLGKVFENLLASYNDDTKTIARKKVGAFYTPRDVVRYMVDEALVFHFASVVSEAKLRLLLGDHAENPLSPEETEQLIAAIEKTRILDPACGSGAFPMGALNRLVHLLAILDPKNVAWKHRQLEAAERDRARAGEMEEVEAREAALASVNARIEDIHKSFDTQHHDLDYARKLYLIENSIFGVDIQPIACQIAKLRFFISLLVDQKSDRIIRPLPNLETRLVAADTLIPIEKRVHQHFDFESEGVKKLRLELQRVRHDHFNARTPEAKHKARNKDAELRHELADALANLGMPTQTARKLASWNPYDQNSHAEFFDPEWMFSLSAENFKGFDIVIGNPPYVKQQKIPLEKPVLKALYDCYSGTADLYVYFYERGIELLCANGVFTFISSNTWMRSGFGEKLRSFVATHSTIRRLVDFGDAEIFEAIAYPCIVVLSKLQPSPESEFRALNWKQDEWQVEDVAKHLSGDMFSMLQSDLAAADAAWRLESKEKLDLMNRIVSAGVPLGDLIGNSLYRGLTTGLNEAFVVDRVTRDALIEQHPSSEEVLKPYIRGRDVQRWHVDFAEQYILFVPWHFPLQDDPTITGNSERAEKSLKTRYPAIYAHLNSFRKELASRNKTETGIRYEWYALQRWGSDYSVEFQRPKIISTKISIRPTFALETNGAYLGNTSYFFPTDDAYVMLAFLNSSISEYYSKSVFVEKQNGYYEVQPEALRKFPIPQLSRMQKETIDGIARAVVSLSSEGSNAAHLERLLNALVFESFFPDELHAEGLSFFDLVATSGYKQYADEQRYIELQRMLSDVQHPLYEPLFRLNGLAIVRMIEGQS